MMDHGFDNHDDMMDHGFDSQYGMMDHGFGDMGMSNLFDTSHPVEERNDYYGYDQGYNQGY